MRRYIRSAAFGANVLGVHAATWVAAERLGAVVAAVEVLLFVTVVLTALFGREKFSDRAFRLLLRSPRVARGRGRSTPARDRRADLRFVRDPPRTVGRR